MSGTLTVANMLRAGKAGTMPAFLSSALHPPASASVALTPTAAPTLPAPSPSPALPVLNANRNVIPEETTAGAAPTLAPAHVPAMSSSSSPDWRALLKRWWPWILLALLALAVMLRVFKPSGRRSSSSE